MVNLSFLAVPKSACFVRHFPGESRRTGTVGISYDDPSNVDSSAWSLRRPLSLGMLFLSVDAGKTFGSQREDEEEELVLVIESESNISEFLHIARSGACDSALSTTILLWVRTEPNRSCMRSDRKAERGDLVVIVSVLLFAGFIVNSR